ncbi:hypothetical protein M153_3400007754 [Pseudoloma neurophilia]|uniref:Uncharacterized protein n=1 Tax=Pseudoloma neurophilia TaxID=146866 RepID=A0A0R0M5L3_9MICR|nr:hypothetical protein M153_3400007754 [Pseudoloma neurophilia]
MNERFHTLLKAREKYFLGMVAGLLLLLEYIDQLSFLFFIRR